MRLELNCSINSCELVPNSMSLLFTNLEPLIKINLLLLLTNKKVH